MLDKYIAEYEKETGDKFSRQLKNVAHVSFYSDEFVEWLSERLEKAEAEAFEATGLFELTQLKLSKLKRENERLNKTVTWENSPHKVKLLKQETI